jgi:hypothetical protein
MLPRVPAVLPSQLPRQLPRHHADVILPRVTL